MCIDVLCTVDCVESGTENVSFFFVLSNLLILTVGTAVNIGRWGMYGRRIMSLIEA